MAKYDEVNTPGGPGTTTGGATTTAKTIADTPGGPAGPIDPNDPGDAPMGQPDIRYVEPGSTEGITVDDLKTDPRQAVTAEAGTVGELTKASDLAKISKAKASGVKATGYDATTQEVDPAALAGERLNLLTSQKSPNMMRAEQQGLLTAASRGLLDSSIAAGAAQGAMVDRATPLALSESEVLHQQALANQAAENRAAEFGAGAENVASLTEAQLGTEVSMFNVGQEQQQAQFDANWANQAEMLNAEMAQQAGQFNASQQNAINSQIMQMNSSLNEQYLRGTQSMDLATIQGQFNTLIAQNETAGSFFSSAMNAIGQAMADPKMKPEQLAAFVRVQQDMIASGLDMMNNINSIDFGSMGQGYTAPQAGSTTGGAGADVNAPGDIPGFGTPEFNTYIQDLIGGLGG